MTDLTAVARELPPPDRLALFLDVDGTLIGTRHEDRAQGLGPWRICLLQRVSGLTSGTMAVLTGRAVESVDTLFAPLILPVAGLQGSDRRFPGGKRLMPVLAEKERRLLERLVAQVKARGFPLEEIEWKPGGIAFVYEEGASFISELASLAEEIIDGAFKVMIGRVALDIVPTNVDKGTALRLFMAQSAYIGRVPVHIGDDTPDEPAFLAASDLGGFGISIGVARPSACYRLSGHESTWGLLEAYADCHGL